MRKLIFASSLLASCALFADTMKPLASARVASVSELSGAISKVTTMADEAAIGAMVSGMLQQQAPQVIPGLDMNAPFAGIVYVPEPEFTRFVRTVDLNNPGEGGEELLEKFGFAVAIPAPALPGSVPAKDIVSKTVEFEGLGKYTIVANRKDVLDLAGAPLSKTLRDKEAGEIFRLDFNRSACAAYASLLKNAAKSFKETGAKTAAQFDSAGADKAGKNAAKDAMQRLLAVYTDMIDASADFCNDVSSAKLALAVRDTGVCLDCTARFRKGTRGDNLTRNMFKDARRELAGLPANGLVACADTISCTPQYAQAIGFNPSALCTALLDLVDAALNREDVKKDIPAEIDGELRKLLSLARSASAGNGGCDSCAFAAGATPAGNLWLKGVAGIEGSDILVEQFIKPAQQSIANIVNKTLEKDGLAVRRDIAGGTELFFKLNAIIDAACEKSGEKCEPEVRKLLDTLFGTKGVSMTAVAQDGKFVCTAAGKGVKLPPRAGKSYSGITAPFKGFGGRYVSAGKISVTGIALPIFKAIAEEEGRLSDPVVKQLLDAIPATSNGIAFAGTIKPGTIRFGLNAAPEEIKGLVKIYHLIQAMESKASSTAAVEDDEDDDQN